MVLRSGVGAESTQNEETSRQPATCSYCTCSLGKVHSSRWPSRMLAYEHHEAVIQSSPHEICTSTSLISHIRPPMLSSWRERDCLVTRTHPVPHNPHPTGIAWYQSFRWRERPPLLRVLWADESNQAAAQVGSCKPDGLEERGQLLVASPQECCVLKQRDGPLAADAAKLVGTLLRCASDLMRVARLLSLLGIAPLGGLVWQLEDLAEQ
mmetsp:Transcript_7426/g.15502  ORF Transcript_7426/g.15502 Transcript_7426/m.15502 type:complete len:209 (-) Transcript_7426:796-1422(-)